MAVRQKSKAEQSYQLLKERLLSGDFQPGDRVSESQIAKKMGLGRVPVREAMLKLQAEGLLKKSGSYGRMYVEYIEDQKIEEVIHRYELREVIEGQACRLAAKNMTGWQIDELRSRLKDLVESFSQDDREKKLEASRRFHTYLLANCGNPLLLRVWEENRLMPFATRTQTVEAQIQSHLTDRSRHHERLPRTVEAIAARDPEVAERTMREYVREITEAIRKASLEGTQ
jgi:DNA-binding GntR family transcriptional regulator